MRYIIWDWNGTLLDDTEICVACINKLLQDRSLPLLNEQYYKEVFTFPVKKYYEAIGFDFSKEDFSVPAHEYIRLYKENVDKCKLHRNAKEVLQWYAEMGCRQFVLSAMHQDMLEKTLKQNEILHFFDDIAGLTDHYAVSKVERGNKLIEFQNIDRNKAIIVGDTDHDFEVARSLGVRCILIANGHQSEQRLRKTDAIVIPELRALMELMLTFSGDDSQNNKNE